MSSDKQSLAEMRKELRELRKQHVKPVSRLRKGDVALELEKLRGTRDTTAPVASTPAAPARRVKAAAESLKESKMSEFQTKPIDGPVKMGKSEASKTKATSSKKDKLARLLALMEDDE
jgi:hypothetical protein